MKNKIVIDYETLFDELNNLNELKNTLIYIPVSSLILFKDLYESYLNKPENDYNLNNHKKFLEKIEQNDCILSSLRKSEQIESKNLIFNKNITIKFVKSSNINLSLFEKDIDLFESDIIKTCLFFDLPLLSKNKKLINIIKDKKIDIKIEK